MLRHRILTLCLLSLFASPAGADPAWLGDESVAGHVVAVEGRAIATIPGEPSRVLVCGDPVYADERLATERGARLVVARDGRHLHVGPESLMVLRHAADGQRRTVLVRGHARVIDSRALPESRFATPAGVLHTAAPDVELRRFANGELQICDWSTREAACHTVGLDGLAKRSVEEGPRLDLGIRNLCPWQPREGVVVADFLSTPHVAAGPETPFEPEDDPTEPGCSGDDCNSPELPPMVPVYVVDAPGIYIP
ncbi:MAG: hypothetical protein JRH10_05030 [Deltaproteobacteria bacterium]|nr:hypothetical protein [Deltaproteobacteria bacterium]